jgi:hypothetical protein
VLSAANWHSLPNGVFCSEFVIRCRNCVGCSELTFAAETELSAANQFSLSNWQLAANQFSLTNWPPAENQLRCRIGSL